MAFPPPLHPSSPLPSPRYLSLRYDSVVVTPPLAALHAAPRVDVDERLYTPPPLRENAEGWHPEWGKAAQVGARVCTRGMCGVGWGVGVGMDVNAIPPCGCGLAPTTDACWLRLCSGGGPQGMDSE